MFNDIFPIYLIYCMFFFVSFEINKKVESETDRQKEIKDKLNSIDTELQAIAENKKEKEKSLKSLHE